MKVITLDAVRRLSDSDLMSQTQTIAAGERSATAALVAHLAEVEKRELHLAAGYGSMFTYCCEALRLSEHEAYNRIEVARASRRFPAILALLAEGAVSLTTVRLLAPHLTVANHVAVLESARGLRKPGVEELVARLAPRPDVPTSIRKLPAPRPAEPLGVLEPPTVVARQSSDLAAPSNQPSPAATPERRTPPATVDALAPGRYQLQVTIGGDTLEKLRLAKDMLRHAIPDGNEAALLDRALSALLTELSKKKFAASDRPGASHTKGDSRYLPAEVRRAVFLRDLGRCAYVGTTSRRCGERAFVEFHHVRPYAEGGPGTVDNLSLIHI